MNDRVRNNLVFQDYQYIATTTYNFFWVYYSLTHIQTKVNFYNKKNIYLNNNGHIIFDK